jgi:mRNA interferase MazF
MAGMYIKRGGIYLAVLDAVISRKISKARPVIVVSNDMNNELSGTVTVLPVASCNTKKIYPFETYLPKKAGNIPKNSKVRADLFHTLDKARFVKFIGTADTDTMQQIESAIRIHLDMK